MTNPVLKLCPFCGYYAELWGPNPKYCRCANVSCDSQAMLIEQWNTRADESGTLDTAIRCLRTAVWRAEDDQQGYQMHPENLRAAKEVIALYEAGEKE